MGGCKSGCVVQPVADHEDLAALRGKLGHAGGFLGRQDARLPVGDAQAVGKLMDRSGGVAGQKLDLHPGGFQRCNGLFRAGAKAVSEGESMGLTVKGKVGRGRRNRHGPAPIGAAQSDAGAAVLAFDDAEKALLKTALAESATLNDGLRKTSQSGGKWRASFMGLTEEQAELACRRLSARAVPCETVGG